MDAYVQMLVNDGMSEHLAQLVLAAKLIAETERLRFSVKNTAGSYAVDGKEWARRWTTIYRLDDRMDRRQYKYRCAVAGTQPVTTVEVTEWIRRNLHNYMGIARADHVHVAGDVCEALNLWDEHGSIPNWVLGLCERVVPREAAKIMQRRQLFVEQPIQYEPDGDVLWA